MMKKLLHTIWTIWDQFWFSPQNLLGLAVMRIIVCGTLFGMYAWRQFYVKWFYTDEGFVPREHMLQMVMDFYRAPFTWFVWSQESVPYVHFVLVVLLFLLTLGIGGRKIMWAAWILNIGFIQRNYGAIYGADLIACIWLFYLSLTQSNARLSIVNFWRKTAPKIQVGDNLTNAVCRLIQIQLCIIYIFTGFEKLKGYSWWDGTALWTVLGNPQMAAFHMDFVKDFPMLLAFLAFTTVLFEVYAPILIWFKRWKPFVMIAGVLFHAGIALLIGLLAFGAVMVSPYLLFYTEEETRSLGPKLKSKVNEFRRAFT